MSHSYIYTHPQTGNQQAATSMSSIQDQLSKYLLNRLELRDITGTSDKSFYELLTEMAEGKHGPDAITSAEMHLQSESLLESAEEYFSFFTQHTIGDYNG